jgi:hypothetical protein
MPDTVHSEFLWWTWPVLPRRVAIVSNNQFTTILQICMNSFMWSSFRLFFNQLTETLTNLMLPLTYPSVLSTITPIIEVFYLGGKRFFGKNPESVWVFSVQIDAAIDIGETPAGIMVGSRISLLSMSRSAFIYPLPEYLVCLAS